ncbi:MAG: hypothetical protein A2X80_00760 [Geobacteraceae bacterium GWB2_52_12]|nr:MAG: hypothetical protein A2X80_00760 [Geobacteraceae bacterium GWB2_52_12]
MSLTEIALIVIAVAVCILLFTLIPTLLAIKRTAASVADLADMVQDELKPTLKELTGVLAELKTVGGGIAEHTNDVKRFMAALGETGDNLSTINRSASLVTGVLSATSVWATGAKVAGKYLFEQFLKKRGGV